MAWAFLSCGWLDKRLNFQMQFYQIYVILFKMHEKTGFDGFDLKFFFNVG